MILGWRLAQKCTYVLQKTRPRCGKRPPVREGFAIDIDYVDCADVGRRFDGDDDGRRGSGPVVLAGSPPERVATKPVTGQSGQSGQPFSNPPEIASENGLLSATLTIGPAELTVAGENVAFPALYDGLYTPPVLRVQPGDTVQLLLNNFARLPTNVHYHGLNVTPAEGGDDIYISIDQGDSFQYDFPIPANHRQGLYWYHPHRDPLLNTQIAGGMAGGIIIGDVLAPFPSLQGIPERVMLLKDLKTEGGFPVEDPDPSGPTQRTINGLFKPRLEMRSGQLEFWRIGNQSSNIFYQLSMGGQIFYVMATDGNLQNQAVATKTLLLPPGARLEVLVYGPPNGTYQLQDAAFSTGPAGDQYPGQLMMTVVSKGSPVENPIPIPPPSAFPKLPDLRKATINRHRTIVFADTADPNLFYINGKPYTRTAWTRWRSSATWRNGRSRTPRRKRMCSTSTSSISG
jgi:FtsP/CotA-like multicopper oxidase with cupredoxin domain